MAKSKTSPSVPLSGTSANHLERRAPDRPADSVRHSEPTEVEPVHPDDLPLPAGRKGFVQCDRSTGTNLYVPDDRGLSAAPPPPKAHRMRRENRYDTHWRHHVPGHF